MRSVAVAVWALLGGLTFAVSLLAGTTSVAHAANSLQESTPAADSTINQSPTQIVLTFENPTGTGTIIQLVCRGRPDHCRYGSSRRQRGNAARAGDGANG